ncbi:hypothetical protein [Bradyrhizobium uaiense]|uniref:Uncharacterized protein n=1 Tax=Bradyrhizobium uaiense TaxID=2594946 RepID=A0A6P1B8D5_9BRAD|nr:hypothetical protein [Bradyrhizobium uaiense]NEU94797.1 hypothetical protein [Bradyrhizobium uaiense]
MKPIQTEHTNAVLGAPPNWDAEANGPCGGLPVLVQDEGGLPAFYSYWRPTWRERFEILFGRLIRLCVVGRTHAPVHLDTELI